MKKVTEEEFYFVLDALGYNTVSDIENVSEYYIGDNLMGVSINNNWFLEGKGLHGLFYLAEYLVKN